MRNPLIQVEVILPSQERSPQSFNINYIISFSCSQGCFTEVIMTRGVYIVDMPYEDFLALTQRAYYKLLNNVS